MERVRVLNSIRMSYMDLQKQIMISSVIYGLYFFIHTSSTYVNDESL